MEFIFLAIFAVVLSIICTAYIVSHSCENVGIDSQERVAADLLACTRNCARRRTPSGYVQECLDSIIEMAVESKTSANPCTGNCDCGKGEVSE